MELHHLVVDQLREDTKYPPEKHHLPESAETLSFNSHHNRKATWELKYFDLPQSSQ